MLAHKGFCEERCSFNLSEVPSWSGRNLNSGSEVGQSGEFPNRLPSFFISTLRLMTGTFSFRNHSAAWKSWAFRPWGQLQLFKMYVDNVQRIYAVGMRCDDVGGGFYCWFSNFFCFDHGDHGSTQILVAISDPNFRHKQNTWNELAWQHG